MVVPDKFQLGVLQRRESRRPRNNQVGAIRPSFQSGSKNATPIEQRKQEGYVRCGCSRGRPDGHCKGDEKDRRRHQANMRWPSAVVCDCSFARSPCAESKHCTRSQSQPTSNERASMSWGGPNAAATPIPIASTPSRRCIPNARNSWD